MRTLLRSLSGTIVLTLLVGAIAIGAEPASPTGAEPVVVTGSLECPADGSTSGVSDGVSVNVHHWTADDPRLAGEATYTGRWQLYDTPAEDSGIPTEQAAAVYSIVNEGGSWLCEETRTTDPPRTDGDRHTLVFEGSGEYQGLTAYLEVDFSEAPYAFSGLILSGEAPPYKEPQG